MKRRNFLKFPIAGAALGMMIARGAENEAVSERSSKGVRVGANADRYQEELQILGGRFDLKISSRDTGGDLCVYDTLRDEKGGPGLHRHHSQDEWFYVIRGQFIVQVGDDTLKLGPGDSAFAPRKTPHTFAMTSEGQGQMLVLFQPAGSMEDFFKQMAKLGKDMPKDPQSGVLKKLWADHGMELLGPPLKI